jgi:hypothetical protein
MWSEGAFAVDIASFTQGISSPAAKAQQYDRQQGGSITPGDVIPILRRHAPRLTL